MLSTGNTSRFHFHLHDLGEDLSQFSASYPGVEVVFQVGGGCCLNCAATCFAGLLKLEILKNI